MCVNLFIVVMSCDVIASRLGEKVIQLVRIMNARATRARSAHAPFCSLSFVLICFDFSFSFFFNAVRRNRFTAEKQ